MDAEWIASGPDTAASATPASSSSTPWSAAGPDQPVNKDWTAQGTDQPLSPPPLVRAHQDATVPPLTNTRSLYEKTRDLLFGHEPMPQDTDRVYSPGILPSVRQDVDDAVDRFTNSGAHEGPSWTALAQSYPHVLGAQAKKLKGGVQETTGSAQVASAETTLAALNVLPQVAARLPGNDEGGKIDQIAQDPLVQKTARSLGLDPRVFAGQWSEYSGLSKEQQADAAAEAQATLAAGQDKIVSGQGSRAQAWADERAWAPSDLLNGKLDPWTMKGIAFNTATALPSLAAVTAATLGGTALGGPGVGAAAGAATVGAIFAPQQREDAKDKIDDQVSWLLEHHLRQQAADLSANSDKIANTAGFLYAAADVAGGLPVSSVLARTPVGKAILDRVVGATVAQTLGGRVAGTMVANGAGGMLQASIQKAVDAGIIHEETPLKDALADIAYTGVISAVTAAPIAAAHEARGFQARVQAQRDLESDQLLSRVNRANEAMRTGGQTYPGFQWNETTGHYEPTTPEAAASSSTPRLTGPIVPRETSPAAAPEPTPPATPAEPGAAPGAAGARQVYQTKIETLNKAAAATEKRSDVTLEPEEDGWSVRVKGQPVAQFDTAEVAREAMAQARKLVGTVPAQPAAPSEVSEPATAAAGTDRRVDSTRRAEVAQMTPEQMKTALLTNDLTGLPNRRAYEESPRLPIQASLDANSLKFVNDTGGHEAGDHLLKSIGTALQDEAAANPAVKVYHTSGDEFRLEAADQASAENAIASAKERLAQATVELVAPDGRRLTLNGIGLSHGIGTTFEAADRQLQVEKDRQEQTGLRARRGEAPPGTTLALPQERLSPSQNSPAAAGGQTPLGAAADRERLLFARRPSSVEDRFATDLQADHSGAVQRYNTLPASHGGKILNVDTARELSPDYLADRTLSQDVHEPASAFIKKLYAERLAQPAKSGDHNVVMFTAGGTGAGKTTAVKGMSHLKDLADRAHIIYDTNLNGVPSASKKIDQALAAHKAVRINYVYRDPVEALVHGTLPRAMATGRPVQLAVHAETHKGSFETVKALQEKYADNPNVVFSIIDNTGNKGSAAISSMEKLAGKRYDVSPEELKNALKQERKAGRIDDKIYRATLRNSRGTESTGRLELEDRSVSGGQLESQRAERGSDELEQIKSEDLAKKPDLSVTSVKTAAFPSGQAALRWALNHLRGTYKNSDTGWNIQVARAGLEKATSMSRRAGDLHLRSLRALPDLLNRAVLAESYADKRETGFKAIHRFYAPVEINGELYRAKLTVRERDDGNKFYDQSLSKIEKAGVTTGSGLSTEESSAADKSAPPGPPASKLSVRDLLADVNRDENNTPFFTSPDSVKPEKLVFAKSRNFSRNLEARQTEIHAIAKKITDQFAIKPKEIIVAQSLDELKDHPEVGDSLSRSENHDAVAFLDPTTDKIYFIAEGIHSPEQAAALVAHEYIVHYGLRAALGSKRSPQYQRILNGVKEAMPADVAARGDTEFGDAYDPDNIEHTNRAAEETLAYYAESYANDQSIPARLKRWVDRFVATLRDWVRKVLRLPEKFDELFIKRTIGDLEGFLKKSSTHSDSSGGGDGRSGNLEEVSQGRQILARPHDPFYSALARAIDQAKREKGTGAEWEATLRNMPGVKPEEMQWTGIKEWLEGRGRVTKAEVADYVNAHRVQLGEVVKGTSPELNHLRELADSYGYRIEPGPHGGLTAEPLSEHVGEMPQDLANALEVFDGGDHQPTRYQSWATPGGENYRELLMTLPSKEEMPPGHEVFKKGDGWGVRFPDGTEISGWRNREDAIRSQSRNPSSPAFKSQHWDEPNILAHVRFDDRTGPNGEKILHVHEVQSDWHQAGRREGYQQPVTQEQIEKWKADGWKIQSDVRNPLMPSDLPDNQGFRARYFLSNRTGPIASTEKEAWEALNNDFRQGNKRVPNAPFKTTWPELAMKRMLRMATEGGYDKLSWDTGDTNAERYNMSNSVDKIAVSHNPKDNTYDVLASKGTHTEVQHTSLPEAKLRDLLGKDMAQKAVSNRDHGLQTFTGEDLKIGGSGMRAFYDDILPKTVNKLVKKWGSSVEPLTIPGEPASNESGWESTESQPGGTPDLTVHSVAITPTMRDSVMQGQPLFRRRNKTQVPAGAPFPSGRGAIKAGYELARRAVAAIPQSELALSIRRIADPTNISTASQATALVTREALGELAHSSEEALHNLERFARTFEQLSIEDRYRFIDAMEAGDPQPIQEHQAAADAIRSALDDWRERIRGLGTGALDNFIENYFPHIWQDPDGAKKALGKIFGRRPLKGPATFLKERTIPTTREGLQAGLKPISTNPLILAFAKLREMQRFYTGVKLMQRYKDEGLAKFLSSSKLMPEGWKEIEDAVGRVRQWSETEGGFIERGKYIMPEDAARVINNHLGASALRNFVPAQLFRSMTNVITPLQLSFSAFHLGFTTLDAVISKWAVGIERLAHGEPIRALNAFLEGSTGVGAAALNLRRGYKLLKAYTNVGASDPLMQQIVKGLQAAGGRIKMDNYYLAGQGRSPFQGVGFASLAMDIRASLTQPLGKVEALGKTMSSFPMQYATAHWRELQSMWEEAQLPVLQVPLEIVGRTMRASTALIMEHIVPLQKLGVFSDLAADHIRRNPEEDAVAFSKSMQSIWNSVDNRLGELVYDNLFWNRTFKEVNHMSVRAVGWNLGTVRELGGAPVDVVKLMDYIARGAPPETLLPELGKTSSARLAYEQQKATWQRVAEKVGHKIPYTLALIGASMLLGAILTRLFTGKDPEETKDYFFPRTGRLTKYGTPERISMPSYTKDLYEYGTEPIGTIINKANPIFGMIHAIYANEDFFGNPIRHAEAGVFQQLKEGASYVGRELVPFSVQGGKQFLGSGDKNAKAAVLTAMPYVGFGPAPARVTSPTQMDRYQHREEQKGYVRSMQLRLKKAIENKASESEINEIKQDLIGEKRKLREVEHEIRTDQVEAREKIEKIGALVHGKSKPDSVAALHQAGYPALARLWASMPDIPRARVATSLQAFA